MMFTAEEEALRNEIRTVYNSGQCGQAVQLAIDFLRLFPASPLARYSFAVMHGDFADDPLHSAVEKDRLIQIAKSGLVELINDPSLTLWPVPFQFSVRNEYDWFFEMHEEQYQLGLERLKTDPGGNYSACVGAAMMALKELRAGRIGGTERWASTALDHFAAFEAFSPSWYNINHFGAQAHACLGHFDRALACFKEMYRKQGGPENQIEIERFLDLMREINELRTRG